MICKYGTWKDEKSLIWRVITPKRRIKHKMPCDLAVRRFVYKRDNFKCKICGDFAKIPEVYTGKYTLSTNKKSCLVIDHIVSLRNGGNNHPDNLQTLCDSCNARKSSTVDRWFKNGIPKNRNKTLE